MVKSYTELPLELTIKIADHLEFDEDLKRFGQVCSSWRSARKLSARYAASRKAPWLMRPVFSEKRLWRDPWVIVQLCVGWIYERSGSAVSYIDLLNFEGETETVEYKRQHLGSSRGWLVWVDDSQEQKVVSLVHPFTGDVIRIPDLPREMLMRQICSSGRCDDDGFNYDLVKFALSGCPNTCTYYTLAVIFFKTCNGLQDVCFWNSKNREWVVHLDFQTIIHDITFYKGHFYIAIGFGFDRIVVTTEFGTEMRAVSVEPTWDWQVLSFDSMDLAYFNVYLVESSGVLLQVVEYCLGKSLFFKVIELDVDNCQAKEVRSLGNKALFVSYTCCFSVEASPYFCKPNCIYFLGNDLNPKEDMSVYDLTSAQLIENRFDPSGEDNYFGLPSFWVEPPSINTTPYVPLNKLHFTYCAQDQNSAYFKNQYDNMWDFVRFVLKYDLESSVFYNIYSSVKTKGIRLFKEWKLR